MSTFEIAGRKIGAGQPPYIIAEIGANHNGDMDICFKLIDAAAKAGADAVKFQSWTADSLISRLGYERSGDPNLKDVVKKMAMTQSQFQEAQAHCKKNGIHFFASCFAKNEIDFFDEIDAPAFKVASMDVNYHDLLTHMAKKGRPIILSTGMATMSEIDSAYEIIRAANPSVDIAILHCVSVYPADPNLINLLNIPTLAKHFNCPIGFSDHTLGNSVALGSIALGATIIEKHFTLDRAMEGWDHAVSCTPTELKELCEGGRDIVKALGSTARTVGKAEMDQRTAFRRRAFLANPKRKGEKVTADDLVFKRPGNGINPDEMKYLLGRTLAKDIDVGETELNWEDLV